MPSLLALRHWPAHLLAAVAVAVAGVLGAWQLDAWQAQRAAEARDLTRLDPTPLSGVMGPDDVFPGDRVGQPVFLGGEWVPEGTVLVSGREQDGTDGFWVLTPVAVTGPGDPALPVVRGWTADPADVPPPPEGYAELTAWLQPPEGATGVADEDPSDDVLPQVRTADLLQHVDQDLYGAYAVVAASADDVAPGAWPVGDRAVNDGTAGLAPATLEQLPPVGRFTALRNLLYALEWWVFGGFAAFLWWRYVQDARAAGRQDPQPDPIASGT